MKANRCTHYGKRPDHPTSSHRNWTTDGGHVTQTVDLYGRTVAEVYSSGRNVNLELVSIGAAYSYRKYLSGCDEVAYLGAEREAEKWRRGVWRSGSNEQKPWDFRKSR